MYHAMTLRDDFLNRNDMVGSWASLTDSDAAEVVGGLGFDFVTFDMEHSPRSASEVSKMMQGLDAADGDTGRIVRVPWNDFVTIKRVLDIGADGILVPMVNTAEEAEEVVEATQYPPDGIRGVGPRRASKYGQEFGEYVDSANDEIVVQVQIETDVGLENVEEIAAVDGVDALFIGPADLSANLGVFGQWESDTFENAVSRIVDAAHAEGKAVGTVVGSVDDIELWVDRGVDYINVGSDTGYIQSGATRHKEAFENAVEERDG